MPVITLSRELGSGGITIAQNLTKRLSWKLIDKEVIVYAAKLAKCTEAEIEKFDQEQFDQMKVLFSDLGYPIPGSGMMYPFIAAGYMEPYWFPASVSNPVSIDETKYIELTKTVILNFAREGNVIIVGRGGCILLKDEPNILHIRVTAPLEIRIQRVMETANVDEPTAKEILLKRDKSSMDYLRHFYQANWSDPLLYHLVINTGKLSLNDAEELIMQQLKKIKNQIATNF